MDNDALEVGLGGGDDADSLGLGEERDFITRKDGGKGREIFQDVFGFNEILARLGSFGHVLSGIRGGLFGSDDNEVTTG